mmetsp:Transcript_5750/g.22704  ORF Transcript_5750/g.22704 Transcript_5750/m.22704 type:complete len:203 (-) Transcript_5750:1100-1708(-)
MDRARGRVGRPRRGSRARAKHLYGGICDAVRAGAAGGRMERARHLVAAQGPSCLRGAPGRGGYLQRCQSLAQARPRDGAHQVRHLFHDQVHEPRRFARARVHRRHGVGDARRHGDGTGPAHEGVPGGCRVAGRASVRGARGGHHHRQDPKRFAHRGQCVERPVRHGHQARVRRAHEAPCAVPHRRGARLACECGDVGAPRPR